jgi:hypothetical protein
MVKFSEPFAAMRDEERRRMGLVHRQFSPPTTIIPHLLSGGCDPSHVRREAQRAGSRGACPYPQNILTTTDSRSGVEEAATKGHAEGQRFKKNIPQRLKPGSIWGSYRHD